MKYYSEFHVALTFLFSLTIVSCSSPKNYKLIGEDSPPWIDPIPESQLTYTEKSRMLSGRNQAFRTQDTISNTVIIELYSGDHPLEGVIYEEGRVGYINRKPFESYSYFVVSFYWEKCLEEGWRFCDSELIISKGEFLLLNMVDMNNFNECRSGSARVNFQVLDPERSEIPKNHRISLDFKTLRETGDGRIIKDYGLEFEVEYHFASEALVNRSFFYNAESRFGGASLSMPDGFYNFERFSLARHNTINGGNLTMKVLNLTNPELKIGIWDQFDLK